MKFLVDEIPKDPNDCPFYHNSCDTRSWGCSLASHHTICLLATGNKCPFLREFNAEAFKHHRINDSIVGETRIPVYLKEEGDI